MLPPGRNKMLGQIKQGGGRIRPTGLVSATCELIHEEGKNRSFTSSSGLMD